MAQPQQNIVAGFLFCEFSPHVYMVDKTYMPSIERTKELLPSLNLSDKEAEEIRDITQLLVEVIYRDWDQKRKKEEIKQQENQRNYKINIINI